MKTKNIKIIQKILNNEKTQKKIYKNINNVLKKIKKLKQFINSLNYQYKLSFKKFYYTKYFKNNRDLVNFRDNIQLKIYNFSLQIENYDNELSKLNRKIIQLTNEHVNLNILYNK